MCIFYGSVLDFILNYRSSRVNVIRDEKGTSFCVFVVYLLVIFSIGGWLYKDGKHVKVIENPESAIIFDIKKGLPISTNFSADDFKEMYRKPNLMKCYNGIWFLPQLYRRLPKEFHITSNLVITPNQTKSKCPEYPATDYICTPDKNNCKYGQKSLNGLQTGKCVKADLPYNNKNVSTCQIMMGKYFGNNSII